MAANIAVVGGGVIGLSTAVRLAENGNRVTVHSGQEPSQTTSAVAAAYWAPYWIGEYDHRWAIETLARLQDLAAEPSSAVTIEPAEEWLDRKGAGELDQELEQAYWWRHLPGLQWERVAVSPPRQMTLPGTGQEIQFCEKVTFRTPVARMPDFLEFLRRRLLDHTGCGYRTGWIDSLPKLAEDYDFLVHCGGWQAVHNGVEDDPAAPPMRLLAGHVARVPMIEGHPLVSLHRGPFRNTSLYIVPRHGSQQDMICGGTAIATEPPPPRDVTLQGDPAICDAIMERCGAFEPRLQSLPTLQKLLGLRPVRHAVRIERDPKNPKIIHNYGHGGAGLTLSWGSANRVARLIADAQANDQATTSQTKASENAAIENAGDEKEAHGKG
jgi:D-amino-acid oxidase